MKVRYVLGIDPSGSFKEGKGTTGWCVYDRKVNKVIEIGSIRATGFDIAHEYWDAHLKILYYKHEQYGAELVVSIEDYMLYKNKTESQINSVMETSQLLGIIKHECWRTGITYYIRPAVQVKKRWTDAILIHKGILEPHNKHLCVACRMSPTCDHERDAIRHAVHCAYFELED